MNTPKNPPVSTLQSLIPDSEFPNTQLLKLGGSLITDKASTHTPRPAVLERLADEIAAARQQDPGLNLVLGHGSGSFGHVPARRYGTRQGVHSFAEWRGFVEVWREAAALNHLVLHALDAAGLPAISLPPSASVTADDGKVLSWDLSPIQAALRTGILPVIYGDVVFDLTRGGTILSTEDLFAHLAGELRPSRILLAGLEPGVWADYPANTRLVPEITPQNFAAMTTAVSGSAVTDVTGGMASKVLESLSWVQTVPGLQVLIFSGEEPGVVGEALAGKAVGTLIHAG